MIAESVVGWLTQFESEEELSARTITRGSTGDGWLTEFESEEELSARTTTRGSTGDGTAPTAHPGTTVSMPGDALALSVIDLMVCIFRWHDR